MKKLLAGLMVLGFLVTGAQQAHASLLGDLKVQIIALKNELISLKSLQKASALNIVSTGDTTPRVMFWSGKVNQHVDSDGAWQTDSDGSSGAGIDKLTYCQKFYPNTISIESYQNETISTWRDAGNTNAYTSTRLSYKCAQEGVIEEVSCTDSDGGNDIYKYGVVKSLDHPELGDTCRNVTTTSRISNQSDPVSSCTDSNCYVQELSCLSNGNLGFTEVKCPYGCSNGACIKDAPITPSITVTSPNGGETYTLGQDFVPRWNVSGMSVSDNITVELQDTITKNKIIIGSKFGTDTAVGTKLPTDSIWGLGNRYKIIITAENAYGDTIADDSSDKTFTINSSNNVCLNGATNYPICSYPIDPIPPCYNGATNYPTCTITTPSITVTSPNGGETYDTNSNLTIKWKYNGVATANDTVNIFLKDKKNNRIYLMCENCENSGLAGINLLKKGWNLAIGQIYTISVRVTDSTGFVSQDESDNSFTMNSSTEDGCKNGEVYSSTTGQKCPAGNTPIISGVSGPQTLNVNQTGTWTVSASDPSGGNLSYSVNWNDSSTFACQSGSACTSSSIQYQQSATFTHKYTNTSIYNPTFTVTNSSGQSAKTSLSVVVGSSIYPSGCNAFTGYSNTTGLDCGCWSTSGYSLSTGQSCGIATPSITVTSPNGGEVYKGGDVVKIKWDTTLLDSSSKIFIYLKDDSSTCNPNLLGCWSEFGITNGNYVSNTGSYSWNTNNKMFGDAGPNSVSVTPGVQYKIKVCNENGNICDYSDNYFTINSSNNVCTNGATNYPTCTTTSTLPVGCTSTYGYSPVTGMKCDGLQNVNIDPGCLSGYNFSSTTGQACINIINTDTTHRTLKLTIPRMTGKDVVELQSYLGLAMDGVYGPYTVLKVKQWQLDHGLTPDGTVGAETRSKMGL